MKSLALWKLFVPLLAVSCFLIPARAEARGTVLITRGETAKDMGELAPEMKEMIEAGTEAGTKMGYCYKYFGIFFLDLWTWEGRPCVFKDDTIWDLPEDVQAEYAKAAPEQLKKPFFYRFPEGLCIIGALVLGAGGLFLFGMVAAAGDKKKADALLASDSRYAQALATLQAQGEAGKAQAISDLVGAGVAADTARENVDLLASAYLEEKDEDEDEEAKTTST